MQNIDGQIDGFYSTLITSLSDIVTMLFGKYNGFPEI